MHVEQKSYHFERPAQWRAGVSDLFEIGSEGLAAPTRRTFEALQGAYRLDRSHALAFDPCLDLHWVRDDTFELVRSRSTGAQVLGRLRGHQDDYRPDALAVGLDYVWLHTVARNQDAPPRVLRYTLDGLQRLVDIDLPREFLGLCGDGRDGAWVVLGGDANAAELRRLSASGRTLQRLRLPAALSRARVATSGRGDIVAVLDADPQVDSCDAPLAFRISLVDLCDEEVQAREIFSLRQRDLSCNRDVPDFEPDRISVDGNHRVHVLSSDRGELWTFDKRGEVNSRLIGAVSESALPVTAFAAGDDLVVSTRRGIGRLVASPAAEPTMPDSVSTFITPTLVSPEQDQSGWLRADLDVDFGAGVAIELSVATADENKPEEKVLIDDVGDLFRNHELPPYSRLRKIDARLPWEDSLTNLFEGDEPNRRRLRFPLHEITDTHLWLRVRIHAAEGSRAAKVRTLQVHYPNLSLARYLPAVYQESRSGAKVLRKLLAILESFFGDLDTELEELPRRIDPETAPDDWVPFLLRWLGLPATTELDPPTRRALLKRAPYLLRERGTLSALKQLLEIVAGDDYSITDSGAGPAPWTLPARCRRFRGSRLGCDTLVLAQAQPGFRLGCEATLGKQVLGYTVLDPKHLFARRSSSLEIRVALGDERRAKIEPLIRRFLPFFVPAHCRYRLRFIPPGAVRRGLKLDRSLRLQQEAPPRLGTDSRAGSLQLPTGKSTGIVLGRSVFTGRGIYLS